jgi:hypothetical protein
LSIHLIDPIADPRWTEFADAHPRASIFHSRGWLDALHRTYGYRPLVVTTTPPGSSLKNGLPVCEIKGWRGNRMVSLPFSDHCEPLIDRPEQRVEIFSFLRHGVQTGRWRYVELRPRESAIPLSEGSDGLRPAHRYCFHRLSLASNLDDIFGRFHPSCMQRAVRKAERERLEYQAGAAPSLLAAFYSLLTATRRRHGMPPQPFHWFENLMDCCRGRVTIRLASRAGTPVAAILALSNNRTVVYKYGGSDAAHHKLGGMPFLFWKTVQEAHREGFEELDLGRSDADQPGLIAFKDHLGAGRSTLTYYRQPAAAVAGRSQRRWQRAASWLFERLPNPALSLAGRMLYKHLG